MNQQLGINPALVNIANVVIVDMIVDEDNCWDDVIVECTNNHFPK